MPDYWSELVAATLGAFALITISWVFIVMLGSFA